MRFLQSLLFRVCMTNLDKSDVSFEIVKAMLAAGANPKAEMAGGTFALYWGIGGLVIDPAWRCVEGRDGVR